MILVVLLLPQLVIEPEAPAIEQSIHGHRQTMPPTGLYILYHDLILREPGNLARVVQGNQVALAKSSEVRLSTTVDRAERV